MAALVLLSLLVAVTASPPARVAVAATETRYVLVDDFATPPEPVQDLAFFNDLGGNRGRIDVGAPQGTLVWSPGEVRATVGGSDNATGMYTSLSRPLDDCAAPHYNVPLDFGALFPALILPQFQAVAKSLRFQVEGTGTFKVELKSRAGCIEAGLFEESVQLTGAAQVIELPVEALEGAQVLTWLVEGEAGDAVTVRRIELEVELPLLPVAERAYLWSFAQLLANWSEETGLVGDRANFPPGDFDNVSATGLLAAAAVVARDLGFISHAGAVDLVEEINDAMLAVPHCHGVLAHFVDNGAVAGEYSSVDTAIALVALLEANLALGLSGTEARELLDRIEWDLLLTPANEVSHGFNTACTQPLASVWTDFGTESWLVAFVVAAATGEVPDFDLTPPTANGSGFIDELAFLLIRPPAIDEQGIAWLDYRNGAADAQIDYYEDPDHACYASRDLFGLSAGERPGPTLTGIDRYQAFGVGGEAPANDGTSSSGHAVVVPHYIGLSALLRPQQAITAWQEVEELGFSPLNNIESLMFTDQATCGGLVLNTLKGSLNLALQALGWGRYLLGADYSLFGPRLPHPELEDAYALMVHSPQHESAGVWRNGLWFLNRQNDASVPELSFGYGLASDAPLSGDWDCDGTDTVGVWRAGTWFLNDQNDASAPEHIFSYGLATDTPLVGDWDGDGCDSVGVWRAGLWFLNQQADSSAPEHVFAYGLGSDRPLAGDWDCDGDDSIGVWRSGAWYLNQQRNTSAPELVFNFGLGSDTPLTGDWDEDGCDGVGVWRSGTWFLNDGRDSSAPEHVFGYGLDTDRPLRGGW
jgi:hypothetical protein